MDGFFSRHKVEIQVQANVLRQWSGERIVISKSIQDNSGKRHNMLFRDQETRSEHHTVIAEDMYDRRFYLRIG